MSTPNPTSSELERMMLDHRAENRALAPIKSSHINTLATKRAHALISGDDSTSSSSDNEHADASISADESVIDIDETCDQVRRKIRNFLEAGEMK
ncbi:MAG: hypothetical protein M1836_007918, partial [Candelina mexicana]